jgi:hypothetical protein
VIERRNEGLLVRPLPLGVAEEIYRRLVNRVLVVDGLLELNADPGWAGAINTVLVKKGLKVSNLRRKAWPLGSQTSKKPQSCAPASPGIVLCDGCTDLHHVPPLWNI